jgi:hypothetical protein
MTLTGAWVDINSAYDHVGGAGRGELEGKRKKWEDRKLGLQMAMIGVNLLLILGVLIAAMGGFDAVVNPAAVLIVVGLAGLVAVSWIPRIYEHVLGDFGATLKVGCRVVGGPGALPALLLSQPGPLQQDAQGYLTSLALDERERECVDLLRDEWAGTIDELATTARSLCSRGDRTGE